MNVSADNQMANASAKTVQIKDDANLGIAMLIAAFGEGNYPAVSSIREAREIAGSDMRGRMKQPERGGEPACPERYVVWAQGSDGKLPSGERDHAELLGPFYGAALPASDA